MIRISRAEEMRDWLLFSNLHIPVVAAGLVCSSYLIAGVPLDGWYCLLAASGSLIVYHWDRVADHSPEDEINRPDRKSWLLARPFFLWGSSLAATIACILSLWHLSWFVRGFAVVLGSLGLIYAVPVFGGRRLKEASGLKMPLIALCWIAGGVLLPLMDAGSERNLIILLASYRLAYVLPNIVTAEYLDRRGDRLAGIRSGSIYLGRTSTNRISLVCLLVAAGIASLLGVLGVPRLPLAADSLGVVGMVVTAMIAPSASYTKVVFLDLWVGFPALIWIVYVV